MRHVKEATGGNEANGGDKSNNNNNSSLPGVLVANKIDMVIFLLLLTLFFTALTISNSNDKW
jgi:hypothetical protein